MKKIFFTFVVLGTFLTLSIPDVNAWTFFSCGGRAAARGVVVSTEDAIVTGVTVLSANDKLAEGIARCSYGNEANTVSTTATKRRVKAYFDHTGHKHSFEAYYG